MTRSIETTEDPLNLVLNLIGVAEDRVVKLAPMDGITAANFEYADLIQGRHSGAVQAAVEKDGSLSVHHMSLIAPLKRSRTYLPIVFEMLNNRKSGRES